MDWIRQFRFKLLGYRRRRALEADMAEELRAHIEGLAASNRAAGMSDDDAYRDALKRFGNLASLQDLARDEQRVRWLDDLAQDLRYGARQLRLNPRFAVTALSLLALGIGANTAVFSLTWRVLLQPVPFENPDRLVVVWGGSAPGATEFRTWSHREFSAFQEENRTLASIAAFEPVGFHLSAAEGPQQLAGGRATPELFSTLAVPALIGRTFRSEDARPGAASVVLLSHRLWQERFGGDAAIVGRSLVLHPSPSFDLPNPAGLRAGAYEVVGVLPASVMVPLVDADLWIPLEITPAMPVAGSLRVIARVASDATHETAVAELTAIESRLRAAHPAITTRVVRTVPLIDQVVGNVRPTVLLLAGSVAFILLMACGNLAGVMLTRALARGDEVAVRVALGATRTRLVRQMLTEGALVAGIAGGLSLLVAQLSMPVIIALTSADTLGGVASSLDRRTLAATLGLSLVTVIGFGLAPAVAASRPSAGFLRQSAIRTSSPWRTRLGNTLVVMQIGLALMLLIGAGLMARSLRQLHGVDLGIDAHRVLTARIGLPPSRYPTGAVQEAFYRQLIERVAALPGVGRVGFTSLLPFIPGETGIFFTIDGRPSPDPRNVPTVNTRFVSPGYLEAAGIAVTQGRALIDGDARQLNVVISEAMARQYWPGEDVMGKRLRLNRPENASPPFQIVGVARDVRQSGPRDEIRPVLYLPFLQQASMMLVVRVEGDAAAAAPALRNAVLSADKDLPLHDLRTLEQRMAATVAGPQARATLATGFALVALALAAVGVYGVVSSAAAQRTREFAIRAAMGAEPRTIARLVLSRGAALTAVGLVVGVGGALAAARTISSLLFGVTATDLVTVVGAAALLTFVSGIACYLPARRAARVDPLTALRMQQ